MAFDASCFYDDLSKNAFPIMEEIRKQGKLCDVAIKVENQSFSAHRIVLAATIPYFQAMFTSDMLESKQSEISIKGIEASAMQELISFAYSGKIVINPKNVQALLVGASYLQLQKVRDACCDFLKNRLHPSNVLSVRSFADALSCTSLVNAANEYIQKHFVEITMTEEFLNLSYEDILEMLSRDELHVMSEEQVFDSVMSWVKKNEQIRKEHLPFLLTRVRMPLLTPQYLADHVSKEEIIRSCHKCRDLVDEAKDYHLMPERRPLLQSFRTRPRCCNDIVGVIYAVGGLTKTGDSLSTVEIYDPIVGRWQMAEAMNMTRSRVGVAVMRNRLYAIGGIGSGNGNERLSTVEVFDPQSRVWSKVSSMNCKRSAVGAAALNDRLYVCGGYDGVSSLNTVECLRPDKNEWTMVSSMSKHRSAAGVIAYEGYVYALGGHDGLSIFDSVEKFNPQTGHWTPVTSMLSKRCRLGVATLNGKLFVCGGYDGSVFLRTVEVYYNNQWTYVAPMNVTRSRVALVSNCGKIYAVGGYDGISNLSSMEVYDPKSNAWSFAASMCAHEGGVGIGVIPAP